MNLSVYYEGGTVDRFWLAPAGLGMIEAKKNRASRFYKTREGARRELLAAQAAQRRAEGRTP